MQECLFIVSSDKEHPNCPSTGGWKKTVAFVYTGILRYYTGTKREKLLTHKTSCTQF